jgi:hypothetical protein
VPHPKHPWHAQNIPIQYPPNGQTCMTTDKILFKYE